MEQAVHSILSLAKERLHKPFFAFREHTLKKQRIVLPKALRVTFCMQ